MITCPPKRDPYSHLARRDLVRISVYDEKAEIAQLKWKSMSEITSSASCLITVSNLVVNALPNASVLFFIF